MMTKNKDEAPEWFAEWQSKSFGPNFESISLQFSNINASLSSVDTKLSTLTGKIRNVKADLIVLKNELTNVQSEVKEVRALAARNESSIRAADAASSALQTSVARIESRISNIGSHLAIGIPGGSSINLRNFEDSCEAFITGFPLAPSASEVRREVEILFEMVGLCEARAAILSARSWNPRSRATPEGSQGSSATNNSTRSVVVRMVSPAARDFLCESANRFHNLKAKEVFKDGGERGFSVRPLWPKDFYNLFSLASAKAKELGYPRPFDREGFVCIRPTNREAAIVTGRSEEDLISLPPNPHGKKHQLNNHSPMQT